MPLLKPPVTGTKPISYFAQSDITCYVLHGTQGDLLIDTGLPQTWRAMADWLRGFDVRYVFLTHAHVDHDWNAAKLQKQGAKLLLHERDRGLRQHYLSQPVQPTLPKYRARNVMQRIGGAIWNSPHYDADTYFSDGDAGMLRELGFDAEIIPLPGHTYGSAGILHQNVLYCGDAFTMLWGKPDITPHAVSPAQMCDSLRTILRLQPEYLACGHGLPVAMREAEPVMQDYLRTYAKSDGKEHHV
jgi:glyoxylase-like metal-dependent hydrolase (beta-lactamase superfamily II)